MRAIVTLSAFAIVLLALSGCGKTSFTGPAPDVISANLSLHTLAGAQSSVFRSGEDFEVRFVLFNAAHTSFCYSYLPPEIEFRIFRGDSLVASSTEGVSPGTAIVSVCVDANSGITRSWTAPSPASRSPKLVLAPGSYLVNVLHGSYNSGKVMAAMPVAFTIEP